ncbi:hypothetical protein V8D89_005774 [Ganoderma adspersum]
MWLLSTDRAELHHFPSPDAVPHGYAILSHTWTRAPDEHEQTFQETQALFERCKITGENPCGLSSVKVRESCILAARYGFRWLWNDTCCIDKTNPTALSEDINSMFLYYSLAELCFAHLEDVRSDSVKALEAKGSAFRRARWHSRGWTLQELIAPLFLVFVSRDWKPIGSKHELARLLSEITNVQRSVLTREMHHSAVSVAERMTWVSERSTTRVEDEAYCLMGLFDVNMPTIYGEGQQAFQRLQQEIMKQSFDTSLFAWGPPLKSGRSLVPLALGPMYQSFPTQSSRNSLHLLASSPRDFAKQETRSPGGVLRYTPGVQSPLQPYLEWQWENNAEKSKWRNRIRRRSGPFGRIELPSFSATNFGLKCRFPIIESEGLTVAVLLCDNGREHLGLLLHPSKTYVQDPSRKQYYIGRCFMTPSKPGYVTFAHPSYVTFARLISLGSDLYNLTLNGKIVTARWRNVFIADSPRAITKDVVRALSSKLHSVYPIPPFRLPHWIISKLMRMGMEPAFPGLHVARSVNGMPLQMEARFINMDALEGVRLIFGICLQHNRPPCRWAKAMSQTADNWDSKTDYSHHCSVHHINTWQGEKMDFKDSDQRIIRLSFLPCKVIPGDTLDIHVELKGRAYHAMKPWKAGVFPFREVAESRFQNPHFSQRITPHSMVPHGTAGHYLGFSSEPRRAT